MIPEAGIGRGLHIELINPDPTKQHLPIRKGEGVSDCCDDISNRLFRCQWLRNRHSLYPRRLCNIFGIIPIFSASAIIAMWVFFSRSKPHLKRWKLAGIIFTACFLFLGGYTAYALSAI